MKRKLRIGFLSEVDLSDVNQLSGTSYHLRRILEQKGFDVVSIDKLYQGFHLLIFWHKLKARLYRYFFSINYKPDWSASVSKVFASRAMRKIKKYNPDIIFTWSTPVLSYLQVNIPKVLYTDATFILMVDFYDNFSKLSSSSIKECNRITHKAFSNADTLIFSSQWAANSAINDYKADFSKVKVVTLGSNIEVSHDKDYIDKLVGKRIKEVKIHLLFIGVNWIRKGGDKAYKIAEYLDGRGHDVVLNIVGGVPPEDIESVSFVHSYGFLNKSNTEDVNVLNELMEKTHFLILPTIADCTPMVFAELNAFGIPAITHDVGGISSVVENNTNGLLCDLNETPEAIGDKLLFYIENPDAYHKLALRSFETYATKLNWDNTGDKLYEHIISLTTVNK